MQKPLYKLGLAAVVALSLACATDSTAPTSPSSISNGPAPATTVAPDGSTLKVAAPALHAPADGARVDSRTPSLTTNDAAATHGGTVMLAYRFRVEDPAGALITEAVEPAGAGAGGANRTMHVVSSDAALKPDTVYKWRVRAEQAAGFGPWSVYHSFTTPALPVTPPRPKKVWPTTTAGLVDFVAAEYPDYLDATSSLHQREVNMAYLRDRMIEAGICGGFDLAWNLKRGVGPRSTDALLHRDGGRDRVIDIAAGFDDYRSPLRLHWIEVTGPPGYDRYLPRPSCQ